MTIVCEEGMNDVSNIKMRYARENDDWLVELAVHTLID